MQLVISPSGWVRALYDEAIPLESLGRLRITRASHVEPDPGGQWIADLTPVFGPVLGPFVSRSVAPGGGCGRGAPGSSLPPPTTWGGHRSRPPGSTRPPRDPTQLAFA